jgi:hypothetical protein
MAFQIKHFGDYSRPAQWFVDAHTALSYKPGAEQQEEEGDLGCYPDGVKRTLTDEQIAMFRHSEIQQLLRERRRKREEEEEVTDYENADDQGESGEFAGKEQGQDAPQQEGARSPVSEASSLEPELRRLARPTHKASAQPYAPSPSGQSSSSRSVTGGARRAKALRRKKREERKLEKQQKQKQREKERGGEVPYDERHKRKWEQFIEDEDQAGNSITHRRIVREMDALPVDELVELDY